MRSKPKFKDDGDFHAEGTLSRDPAADAVPVASTEILRKTERLLHDNVDPKNLSLPSDVHTEAELLAALLWYGTNAPNTLSLSDIQDILENKDRFFSPVHQDIYESMLTVHGSLLPTNVTNVNARLKKWGRASRVEGIDHLEKLRASANPADREMLRGYAQRIRDAWAKRQLVTIADDISNAARVGDLSSDDVMEKAHSSLVTLSRDVAAAASYVSFADVAASMLRSAAKGETGSIPTGLPDLDDLTGGWFPKEVTIIGARTSVGKSALATQFAFDGVKDRPKEAVLYVSLEMPAEQFVARIMASRAGVSLRKIRRKTLDESDVQKLEQAAVEMRESRVFFVDSQIQTVVSISSIASRLNASLMRDGARLALIVVDHIGLVKPSSKSSMKNREQQVAETSRGMKYLAQHHCCHVMALAQVGRESEKQNGSKIPQIFHLRESGSIEQDAENIILIHREKDQHGQFKPDTPAILNVGKARNDGLGLVWCAFDGDRGRFTPWKDSDSGKAKAPNIYSNLSRQYVAQEPMEEDDDRF